MKSNGSKNIIGGADADIRQASPLNELVADVYNGYPNARRAVVLSIAASKLYSALEDVLEDWRLDYKPSETQSYQKAIDIIRLINSV